MALAMRLALGGGGMAWLKGARRWSSALPAANLNKAMEAFYHEREALLRQNLSALLKSKRKQVEGLKPRSIESTIASMTSIEPSSPAPSERPEPILDLSNLFQSSNLLNGKKHADMKQRMKNLTPGTVMATKLISETQEISVSIFVPPAIITALSQPANSWRIRALERGSNQRLLIRLHPQKDRLISCVTLRGAESDLVKTYKSLMALVDNFAHMQRGEPPAKQVQLTKTLQEGLLSTTEIVSGACATFTAPNVVKLWGTQSQIECAAAYLDLAQNNKVTNLTVNYGRGIDSLPSLEVLDGNAHLARATILVPTIRLKIIVGKDAVVLRQLKEASGARIKFVPIPAASGFTFSISGSVLNVQAAVNDILFRLDEYERYLQDVGWRENIALRDREELTRLVGHDFVNIRKIEMMSGAFLRVSSLGDPVLSVRIWGTKNTVERAIKAVYALTRLDSPSII